MSNKPIAVTGMALVLAAVGAMLLLVALGAIRAIEPGPGGGWIVVVFGVAGALALVLAFGLFTLKPWAWPLGIAMVALSVITAVLSAINRGTIAFIVLTLVPAIMLLGGLFLPDVRKAFGRATAAK